MYIQLAYSRELGGKKFKAGDVVETDYDTASNLINRGLARQTRKPRKQEPPVVTESNDKGEKN